MGLRCPAITETEIPKNYLQQLMNEIQYLYYNNKYKNSAQSQKEGLLQNLVEFIDPSTSIPIVYIS